HMTPCSSKNQAIDALSFESYHHHRALHSFPTRRSSDLPPPGERGPETAQRHVQRNGRGRGPDRREDHPRVVHIRRGDRRPTRPRSEEHTSELQSQSNLVCRLLLEKKNNKPNSIQHLSVI